MRAWWILLSPSCCQVTLRFNKIFFFLINPEPTWLVSTKATLLQRGWRLMTNDPVTTYSTGVARGAALRHGNGFKAVNLPLHTTRFAHTHHWEANHETIFTKEVSKWTAQGITVTPTNTLLFERKLSHKSEPSLILRYIEVVQHSSTTYITGRQNNRTNS